MRPPASPPGVAVLGRRPTPRLIDVERSHRSAGIPVEDYCLRRGYLVDPASSHMLVSKIKPCMSKYIPLHGETANGSLNHTFFVRLINPTWIPVVIPELIHAIKL